MPKNKKEKKDEIPSELLESVKVMEKAIETMLINFRSQMTEPTMRAIKAIQPTIWAIETMQSAITPAMKQIEAIQKSFIPLFDNIDFEKLAEKAKEMNTPTTSNRI